MKLWIAPLHGITNSYFREIFLEHFSGADALITPFISAVETEKFKFSNAIMQVIKNNSPLLSLPQIIGNSPVACRDTISILRDSGYERVNINMGCPMKQIVKKNRGCGLMKEPETVIKILEKTASLFPGSISVKMRIGMNSIEEGISIINILNNFPLDFIVIHPRFGYQLYDGNADIQYFKLLKDKSCHKIIYNGDIDTVAKFNAIKSQIDNIEDFMIGRGLLINPFIAEEIKNIVVERNKKERFIDYYIAVYNSLTSIKSERVALGNLKELWQYFAIGLNLPKGILQKILAIEKKETFYQSTLTILTGMPSRSCITPEVIKVSPADKPDTT